MALENCKAEIAKAIGRELNKREEGIVSRRASDLKRKIDRANNDPAAITGILQDYADEAKAAASIAKRNAALNYTAFARLKSWAESVEPKVKNPGEVLLAAVRGSLRNFRGAKDSAANLAQREMNTRSIGYVADLVQAKVAEYAFSRDSNEAIGRALYDMRRGASEAEAAKRHGPLAAKTAAILERHREQLRLDLNRAGAWIGKNDDAIFRRSHDSVKIAKAGGFKYDSAEARKYWVDSVYAKMDWDRAFDGEFALADAAARREVLSDLHTQFAAGTHLKSTEPGIGTGTRNLGKKSSHRRQLVFRSADDEVAYLNEFGRGNSIAEIVRHELQSGGKDIALMRKFGPNPEATFDRLYDDRRKALVAAKNYKGLKRLDRMYHALKENDWNILTGNTGHPADNFVGHWLSAGRTWTSAAAIANSIWSLTGDTVLKASAITQRSGGSVAANIFNGYMRNAAGHGMETAEAAAFAAENGIRFEGITMPLDPYSGESIAPGLASKAMKGVLRFGLHNGWVNRERINSLTADANHYWALRGKSLDALPRMEAGTLEQFGIGAKEWDVLRRQEAVALRDGQMAFTPRQILKMDTAEFKSVVGHNATETQLVKARQRLADSYRNLLGEMADRSTVSPSLANQAFMQFGRSGLRSGSFTGEMYRSALQLKGFVMNYMRNHLGRELHGYNAEYRSFPQAMADIFMGRNPSGAKGLSKLVVAGALNFYVVNALRDLALGKTPLDPFDWDVRKHKTVWETPGFRAAMKAWSKQSFGLYGEILMGESGKPSDGWLGTTLERFVGPEGELVGDMADDITNYTSALGRSGGPTQKELDHASQQLFGTAWRNTPGTSLFWNKWAMDYYVYNQMSDALNPGYRERLRKRMDEQGQTYLMGPP